MTRTQEERQQKDYYFITKHIKYLGSRIHNRWAIKNGAP